MFYVFILLLCFIFNFTSSNINFPACRISNKYKSLQEDSSEIIVDDKGNNIQNNKIIKERLVVIGDLHGSFDGLLDILFEANITSTPTSCNWREFEEWNDDCSIKTIIVQVGDVVDRGNGAKEAWDCLENLQNESNNPLFKHGSVVRLLGNHDLWWMEGRYHHRNPTTDTEGNIKYVMDSMKTNVFNNNVNGAFLHKFLGENLIFVHAGFRPNYITLLNKYLLNNAIDGNILSLTPELLVEHANNELKEAFSKCPVGDYKPCSLENPIFQAGPDRGGREIGGPFWTDFRLLREYSDKLVKNMTIGEGNMEVFSNMIQIVGHSMAHCYDPRKPNNHPPRRQGECLELIRGTSGLAAICVDGGMYSGARTYLEIGIDGHFRAYERYGDYDTPWTYKDMTEELCN
jgi:hypothetical protein